MRDNHLKSPSFDDHDLAKLESDTFKYFLHELHPATGLTADSTREGSPSSIAVVGFALTVYPIAVERRYLSRAEAIKRTLTKLRFFYHGPDGEGPDAIGRKGFYYHFLDMKTGRRTWQSEVSTIDTAILIAGALTAAQYFDRDTAAECELRQLAEELYRRADWVSLDRIHRGLDSLRTRTRVADLPCFTQELSRLDQGLQVERHLRVPISIRRSALHSPAFAHVDRLSRHTG